MGYTIYLQPVLRDVGKMHVTPKMFDSDRTTITREQFKVISLCKRIILTKI